MDWLKDAIKQIVEAEDQADKIAEAISKELPKQFIPKSRFNEVSEKAKTLETQTTEWTAKATAWEEEKKTLTAQIAQIKAESDGQLKNLTKKSTLKEVLLKNGAHPDALDLMIEKYAGEAEVDENGLKEPEKFIAKLKAERAGLFVQKEPNSNDKGGNTGSGQTTDVNKIRKMMGLPEETTK